MSEGLLAELTRTLGYPRLRERVSEEDATEFGELLRSAASIVADAAKPPPVSADPGDDYLIALATTSATFWPGRQVCPFTHQSRFSRFWSHDSRQISNRESNPFPLRHKLTTNRRAPASSRRDLWDAAGSCLDSARLVPTALFARQIPPRWRQPFASRRATLLVRPVAGSHGFPWVQTMKIRIVARLASG